VTLKDGLYLPCVVFRNSSKTIDLAIRRFKEEQSKESVFGDSSGLGYREIVKSFVTKGNCINHFDISKIDVSDFAFPKKILQRIDGETMMGWTGFVAKMKDGKQFAFGTTYLFEFFNMPKGYLPNDIAKIISHSFLDKDVNLKSYHVPEDYEQFDRSSVFRERPYFECFLDNL
jgi:hypothetical protein